MPSTGERAPCWSKRIGRSEPVGTTPRGDPAVPHGHTDVVDAIGHLTEEMGRLTDGWLISRWSCEACGAWVKEGGVATRGGSLPSRASRIPAATTQTRTLLPTCHVRGCHTHPKRRMREKHPSQTQAVGIVQRKAEGSAGPSLKHTGCTPTGHPSNDVGASGGQTPVPLRPSGHLPHPHRCLCLAGPQRLAAPGTQSLPLQPPWSRLA